MTCDHDRAEGERILLAHLLGHADDVYRAMTLPTNIDPRCLGSVPGPLARAGIIRFARYERSDRRERHASVIAGRELVDADAARDWLARHPVQADELGPAAPSEKEV